MSEDKTVRTVPMRELIAEEIRALLGRRQLSASELARRMGVSQRYMSRRITGETALDVDDLEKIAAYLGVEVVALFPRTAGSSEGRLITTVGTERGRDQHLNEGKSALTTRPGPNGHPKRTLPHPATRRPARLSPAHAH